MAPIVIYGMPPSPPCRILTMVCEVLGLKYEMKPCNIMAGDNRKPEYLKMNPQHTIPTLVDGDFIMTESRAAALYLVAKYGGEKKAKLYPSDVTEKAKVDQKVFFEMGTFNKAFGDCVFPILMGPATEVGPDQLARLKEVVGWVHDFAKEGFVAGTKDLTVADICFVATYSTLEATGIVDLTEWQPVLDTWLNKCKGLIPNYEECNGSGAMKFGGWFKSVLESKNKK